jgi:hypothetical protein
LFEKNNSLFLHPVCNASQITPLLFISKKFSMLKSILGLALLCTIFQTEGAQYRTKPAKNKWIDSSSAVQLKEEPADDMPVITLNESERSENNLPFVPSLLFANRDAFMSVAGFHFSVTRFRMRGYDGELFSTQINGMPYE